MKINNNIKAISTNRGLDEYETELAQYVWNNRNKMGFLTVSLVNVDSDYVNYEYKVGIIRNGTLINISSLIGKLVSTVKYNVCNNSINIRGGNMNMGSEIAKHLYESLSPASKKEMSCSLEAVASVNCF